MRAIEADRRTGLDRVSKWHPVHTNYLLLLHLQPLGQDGQDFSECLGGCVFRRPPSFPKKGVHRVPNLVGVCGHDTYSGQDKNPYPGAPCPSGPA